LAKSGRSSGAAPINRASGDFVANLEIALKRDERVIRFLTVKLDKHAVAYNEKKRARVKEEVKEESK
jgi:ribosomal protein S6